jgi:hypothetical protein
LRVDAVDVITSGSSSGILAAGETILRLNRPTRVNDAPERRVRLLEDQ